MKIFEEYLKDQYAEQYRGSAEDKPGYEKFLSDLQPDEWIDYATWYSKEIKNTVYQCAKEQSCSMCKEFINK